MEEIIKLTLSIKQGLYTVSLKKYSKWNTMLYTYFALFISLYKSSIFLMRFVSGKQQVSPATDFFLWLCTSIYFKTGVFGNFCLLACSHFSAPALPFLAIPSCVNRLKHWVFFHTLTGSPATKAANSTLGEVQGNSIKKKKRKEILILIYILKVK